MNDDQLSQLWEPGMILQPLMMIELRLLLGPSLMFEAWMMIVMKQLTIPSLSLGTVSRHKRMNSFFFATEITIHVGTKLCEVTQGLHFNVAFIFIKHFYLMQSK